MTRKTAFFEGWSWFKFNNLGLALGANLKFYTNLSKGLELKFRKFWGLILTFVEATGEKLVGGGILNKVKYLQECIVFQVLIANKLCNFISLCRSFSQPTDLFDQFADNVELTLDEVANHNLLLIVVLGDFNVKSENCYKHHRTSSKGARIDALTSQFGLQQIIKEPTLIFAESSSCIDLIFTAHQNLVMEYSSLAPSSKLSSLNNIC